MHKIRGAHHQCVNNHYAKFEYKGVTTVEATDNTNQTPSKHFEQKKMSKFKTLKSEKNIREICTK